VSRRKDKLGPVIGRGKGRIDEDVTTDPIDRIPVRQKHRGRKARRAKRR
jgi:hypothetical protein